MRLEDAAVVSAVVSIPSWRILHVADVMRAMLQTSIPRASMVNAGMLQYILAYYVRVFYMLTHYMTSATSLL